MREIKFRAWDKNNKFMIFIQPVDFEAGCDYFTDDNYIIEQFTGLLDKNGREIYEGDIIQTETCVAAVVFDECQFGLRAKPDKNYVGALMDLITWRSIEIIGNIHENPELLL